MLVVRVIIGKGESLLFFLYFCLCLVVFNLLRMGICKFISIILMLLFCILDKVFCLFLVIVIWWFDWVKSRDSKLIFCVILFIISICIVGNCRGFFFIFVFGVVVGVNGNLKVNLLFLFNLFLV